MNIMEMIEKIQNQLGPRQHKDMADVMSRMGAKKEYGAYLLPLPNQKKVRFKKFLWFVPQDWSYERYDVYLAQEIGGSPVEPGVKAMPYMVMNIRHQWYYVYTDGKKVYAMAEPFDAWDRWTHLSDQKIGEIFDHQRWIHNLYFGENN